MLLNFPLRHRRITKVVPSFPVFPFVNISRNYNTMIRTETVTLGPVVGSTVRWPQDSCPWYTCPSLKCGQDL